MTRSALVFSALMIVPGIALAQEPAADDEAVDHTVVRGESLWFIAGRYYDDPFQWPRIYDANVDRIEDPHWIYPDQEFLIPGFGMVVLGSPEDRAVGADGADGGDDGTPGVGARTPSGPTGAITGSVYPGPGERTVFSQPPRENIQAPPQRTTFYGSISEQRSSDVGGILAGETTEYFAVPGHVFYSATWYEPDVQEGGVDFPGEVTGWAGAQSHVRRNEPINPYDEIEVAWEGSLPMEGSRVQFVRVSDAAPTLGELVRPTALGRVVERVDSAVIVVVSAAFGAPRVGDSALPAATYPLEAGEYAEEGGAQVRGTVVGFARDGVVQQPGEVAFLDVGSSDGVAVGDVFGVELGADDGRQPEIAYTLEVVRVFSDRSSARVSRVTVPAFDAGVPVRRIRRMP